MRFIVRFFERRSTVLGMERRRHRRVRAQIKSLLKANAEAVEGEAVDLSIGGAQMTSPLAMKPGKQVTVKLVIPGADTPIYIEHAEVRWVRDCTFGLKFLEITRSQLDELEQVIDDYLAVDESRKPDLPNS